MGSPVFRTERTARSCRRERSTSTLPASPAYFTALSSRIITSRSRLSGSPERERSGWMWLFSSTCRSKATDSKRSTHPVTRSLKLTVRESLGRSAPSCLARKSMSSTSSFIRWASSWM